MAVRYTANVFLDNSNNCIYVNSYKKKTLEANTDVQKFQKNAEAFRKSVKELNKYSSKSSIKSKLVKQIKGFVDSYNSMKESSGKVTDKELDKQLEKLDELLAENDKKLGKIGIKNDGGELEFDSEVFEETKGKAIDELFAGSDSFIRKVRKIMRGVEDSAEDAEFSLTERKISNTTQYSGWNIENAKPYTAIGEQVVKLKDYSKLMTGSAPLEESSKQAVSGCLKAFVEGCADFKDAKESELIKDLCKKNADKLNDVGISVDADGNAGFNELSGIDVDSKSFRNAYQYLFGGSAAFGKAITDVSKAVLSRIEDPKKTGASAVNAYV